MSKAEVLAADLFCGGGGTSTGLAQACLLLNRKLKLLAINHWDVAIDTHSTNHPLAKHLCQSIDNVEPRKAVPGGRLHILVASPECTHHSNARGGKPMSEQSRASAWHILRWAEALYIENIIIENVREFRTWGPIGANGRPIKRLRGHLYIQFLNSLRALGYNVEDRILNAADFGDPTTRERLFIICRRGKPVYWPEPCYGPPNKVAGGSLIDSKLQPWRTARGVIDWSIPGQSIFTRKRPLATKTIARIAAGLRRFGGANAEPFLVVLRNHQHSRSIDQPLPTVTGSGAHFGLCQPFVIGQQSGATPRSVDAPLPTIAAKGAIAMVDPFLVAVNHDGEKRRSKSVDEPLPTVTTKRSMGLVEPFILPQSSEGTPRSVDRPLQTLTTTSRGVALVEPFLLNIDHQGADSPSVRPLDAPVPTQTSKARTCLVEPFIAKFNGTAKANSVDEPLDTVTTKDRFALVTTEAGQFYVDIRFRMLQPHELARAQGFGDSYTFKGTREDVVRQIGNAVPVATAAALCSAVLQDRAETKERRRVLCRTRIA
jgi:DNA (cytosine-5)-methyltransferase 1